MCGMCSAWLRITVPQSKAKNLKDTNIICFFSFFAAFIYCRCMAVCSILSGLNGAYGEWYVLLFVTCWYIVRCKTAQNALQNGPFCSVKWAESHAEMAHFAKRYGQGCDVVRHDMVDVEAVWAVNVAAMGMDLCHVCRSVLARLAHYLHGSLSETWF